MDLRLSDNKIIKALSRDLPVRLIREDIVQPKLARPDVLGHVPHAPRQWCLVLSGGVMLSPCAPARGGRIGLARRTSQKLRGLSRAVPDVCTRS